MDHSTQAPESSSWTTPSATLGSAPKSTSSRTENALSFVKCSLSVARRSRVTVSRSALDHPRTSHPSPSPSFTHPRHPCTGPPNPTLPHLRYMGNSKSFYRSWVRHFSLLLTKVSHCFQFSVDCKITNQRTSSATAMASRCMHFKSQICFKKKKIQNVFLAFQVHSGMEDIFCIFQVAGELGWRMVFRLLLCL